MQRPPVVGRGPALVRVVGVGVEHHDVGAELVELREIVVDLRQAADTERAVRAGEVVGVSRALMRGLSRGPAGPAPPRGRRGRRATCCSQSRPGLTGCQASPKRAARPMKALAQAAHPRQRG